MTDTEQPAPTVFGALGDLWRALTNRMRGRPEYNSVFLYEEAYKDDSDHLQRVADKFATRGRRLRREARLTLFASLAIILGGVAVFLAPTKFSDIDPAKGEIDSAQVEKEGILIPQAEAEIEYLRARDVYNLLGMFHEISNRFANFGASTRISGNPVYSQLLGDGLSAARELGADEPVARTYSFERYQYHPATRSVRLPGDVFEEGERQISQANITIGDLEAAFRDLDATVQSGGEESSEVKALVNRLKKLDPLYTSAKKTYEELDQKLDDDARNSIAVTQKLLDADKRISEALYEARQSGTAWSDQAWLTIITVRIGVVVLLLYLTSVLLASYRYTQTLAAYYTARSDALQLLSDQPEGRLLSVEELAALTPLLSPDSYRIDAAKAPYEAAVESAQRRS